MEHETATLLRALCDMAAATEKAQEDILGGGDTAFSLKLLSCGRARGS